MAWGVAGSVSPSSAVDEVDVSITNTSDFNQFIWHGEHSGSGTVQYALRMDDISSGNKYASTFQEDNSGMVNQDGQNGINVSPTAPAVAEHTFMMGYACHTGDEKLCIADMVFSTGTGAGSKPSKASVVGKTTDTSTIDNISVNNLTSGSDFSSSSRLSVFGSDLTLNATAIDFTNVQVGSRLEETDTIKMYNYTESDTISSTPASWGDFSSTTGSQNIGVSSTYKISAQKIHNSSSNLNGKTIGKIGLPLRLLSGTGTATAGVFNSSGAILHTFGTIDISTLSTGYSPYTWYDFTGTSLYTLAVGEYVGIKMTSGSGTISVAHRDSGTQYDGGNSYWDRWNGSAWSNSFTSIDQSIKLYVGTTGGTFAWQEIGS